MKSDLIYIVKGGTITQVQIDADCWTPDALGKTEWNFSDGPSGARGSSSDYCDLLQGLRRNLTAEFNTDEADFTPDEQAIFDQFMRDNRLKRDALLKRQAYRARHSEVEEEATKAAEAAKRVVREANRAELEALSRAAFQAERAHEDYVSENAADPHEGRIVERTVVTGKYSWNRRETTERGRLEVRRKDTQFADSVWRGSRSDIPALGTLFIRRIKADGSDGSTVIKVYQVREDGTISAWSRGDDWKLVPVEAETAE